MDDRELEARLKTRLHARFDDAPIPVDLAANLRQAMATPPTRVGFALAPRGRLFGWTAVAAAVAIAIVAVTLNERLNGPAAPGRSLQPTLGSTAAPLRRFIVLAPGSLPDKAISSRASDVLGARVSALGIGNFTSGIGDAITFRIPAEGPSDETIRAVLAATGDVEFVPVPPNRFNALQPQVGDTLPADLPAMFGNEGVVSVSRSVSSTQGLPVIDIKLTPAATTIFGDYTVAHQGDYVAIVLDGRIALLPVVNEPIPGGEIQVSDGGPDLAGRPDTAFDIAAAILVGGKLPAAWQGASVPVLISEDRARTAALAATSGGTVQEATQSVEVEAPGDGARVVWNVEVDQPGCADGEASCVGLLVVKVDGVTGTVLHIGALEP